MLTLVLVPFGGQALALEKMDVLVISGPFAAVSDPLAVMVEQGALQDVTRELRFEVWENPDQMRALSLNGQTHFMAMPTNVAANLYNRGADLKLLNVSVWGVLYMVSRDPDLKTLADFQGQKIAIPFRGDLPDIVFSVLAEEQGLDLDKDFDLKYVANPLDAMRMLLMRRIDHALLAEPAVSMALHKTRSGAMKIVAPDLYRSVDLQEEWGQVFQSEGRIPQAGMVLLDTQLPPQVVSRFMEEYDKALVWVRDHPEEAGRIVARYVKKLNPEAVATSIAPSRFRRTTAAEARAELEFFFETLLARNPALVGGAMPAAGFYYSAPEGR
ncbi:ABC transporter substrate-binding protein [bacterium DOLZORAL124_64_63]|nr:MAG: ABC transporter substrate-binding protein [bacterium DOLZORAL124_64_63]